MRSLTITAGFGCSSEGYGSVTCAANQRAGQKSYPQWFSIAGADFPYVACAQRPVRASSALGCPRKAEPTLLQFVANDVNWLSPIDHE